MDRSFLSVIPEAPRIAEQGFPPNFDWKFLPAKFYDKKMSFTQSDLNLSSNVNENGMRASSSAFDILSRSNSNLNEAGPDAPTEADPEAKEETLVKKSAKKSSRPKSK